MRVTAEFLLVSPFCDVAERVTAREFHCYSKIYDSKVELELETESLNSKP